MSYDEALAERIRRTSSKRKGVTEKNMFGGVAFLVGGHMFCGIVDNDLMVRVGPERYDAALGECGARPMDFTGRPMKGYVFVERAGYDSDAALKKWVSWAVEFASTLPAKEPAHPPRGTRRAHPGSRSGREKR